MGDKSFIIVIDKFAKDRLRIRIETVKGKVKYFVVQYETIHGNKWYPVVRYDLAHGFFHRDILNPKGEKEKQVIQMHDLNDALSYAQQDLKDRWEFYKDRFLKQMRK